MTPTKPSMTGLPRMIAADGAGARKGAPHPIKAIQFAICLFIVIALLAFLGRAHGAESMPGYTYGKGPDGQPFWQQCNPDGYCYGRAGDPAQGGGKPVWYQEDAPAPRRH
jgi:hypothetical protein